MYRLDVCISHCEQIGRNLHESHRTLLKSIETHVDIFVYATFGGLEISNLGALRRI